MAGVGSEGAMGALGLQQALRQMIVDRLTREQQGFNNQLQLRSADRADQALAQNDELKRLQIQSMAETRADANRNRDENTALRSVAMRPTGAEVTPEEYQRETKLGIPSGLYAPQGNEEPAPPESIAAQPMLKGQLRMMPGTVANSPSPSGLRYMFKGTQAEADKQAELERKTQHDTEQSDLNNWKAGISQDLANFKMSQPPPAETTQLKPEVDPATGKETGRYFAYNPKAKRFDLVAGPGPMGTKAAPGAAQAAQHDQSKKEALGSLDQLDQAIEAARSLIGPGAGRISSIQQMVGNPDPKISTLGTKMLLAKMQVDHAATGTVRAGASPQLLARWDNILGNVQNAESLKASVQAMREILGGHAPEGPAAPGNRVYYDMNGNPIKR